MSSETTALATFAIAALLAWLGTPIAIRVACRTCFFDHPVGYKGHTKPTPYLGGAAVMSAFLLSTVILGAAGREFAVILGCAIAVWALGTLDDRVTVRPRWRILAVVTMATILWGADLGWSIFGSAALDLTLTILWVLGLVNACNLLDNIDGATSSVAGVSTFGAGVLALASNQGELAALAFGISGACVGFLPYNLAAPARIFLGDGGSMPIGLLVASVAMLAAAGGPAGGGGALVAGTMLVGLFVFDTTLVVVSRSRQRIPLTTGGRDHVTHRLLAKLKSARRVALALASIQAILCAAAISGAEASWFWLALLAVGSLTTGLAALVLLDSPSWRPKATWIESKTSHQLAMSPTGPTTYAEPLMVGPLTDVPHPRQGTSTASYERARKSERLQRERRQPGST